MNGKKFITFWTLWFLAMFVGFLVSFATINLMIDTLTQGIKE